jgi:drug/metabolite transporter (DMT)-like permease
VAIERDAGPEPPNQLGRAIGWSLLGSLCFAALWGFIKWASFSLDSFVIVFWRNLVGLIVLAPLLVGPGLALLRTRQLPIHFRRAGSSTIAVFATFYAIANAPMASVMAINYAAPLFATLLAAVFLGERIRARRIIALAIGFAGVLIVLRPGAAPLDDGMIAAMISAVMVAVSIITIKQLTANDDPRAVVIWSFLLMLPVSFLVALPFWQWPSGTAWLAVIGVGAAGAAGQLCLTRAFSLASATAILPYDFVRLAGIALIGIFIFGEAFDQFTIAGGLIIFASTIYLAHRERIAARELRPASTPKLDG